MIGLLLVPLAAPVRAETQINAEPLLATGIVERVSPAHRLTVRAEDQHLYTVRAASALIELPGGDRGRWDDLRPGQEVDLYGTLVSARTVRASGIRIIAQHEPAGGFGRDDRYYTESYRQDTYREQRYVDLTGTVASVDRDRQSLRLRTGSGLRSVELYDGTRLELESGDRAYMRDLRAGDPIRVQGEIHSGRIVADQVTLLERSADRYAEEDWSAPAYRARDVVIYGTVRTPTYDVSRKVTVRTADGDITVVADPRIPITKYDYRASIHDLEKGDRVRVVGDWESSARLRARRIDVEPPPPEGPRLRERVSGYRSSYLPEPLPEVTIIGELVSFDGPRNRMRLSTHDGDRIVVANGAPAYVHGQRIDRTDFIQGDRIRATGSWDGEELHATRVELAF
jgi:hypothetical protein